MKTHILADDVVYVDLSSDEHVALAGAIRGLLEEIAPERILDCLGVQPSAAYGFEYSLLVLEQQARAHGIDWLAAAPEQVVESEPVFAATFDDLGCSWRLTLDQLRFVEACTAEEHRRGEHEHRVTVYAV